MGTYSSKPVTRQSSAYVRDKGLRPVIVTINGPVIELRAKGLRRTEYLDLAFCYQQAIKQRVQREKSEKAALRKRK